MATPEKPSTTPGFTDPTYKPQPGRLGNLTDQQQLALDTLRKEIQGEGWFVSERMDDPTLLRCARTPAPSSRDNTDE